MKRIIASTFLIISLLGVMIVYADENDISETRDMLTHMKILDEGSFSVPDAVSREECLVAIMRVIGVTDEEIKKLNGGDLLSFEDSDSFSYEGCAYLGGIAYGEECVVDYPTKRTRYTQKNTDFFFFPDRAVTTKECLAFMVRCLEKTKENNLNSTFERAKEYCLIKAEDDFIQNTDSAINQDNFCTLLGRMLQQKRYKYYARENNRFKMDGNIDEEKSMTYLEFLTHRQITE